MVVILIAEDEPAIADVVAAVVEDAGHTAVVATHGQQALDRAREQWPTLLITDLMMPHLTGTELIRALRVYAQEHASAPLPVILMTAAGRKQARAAGADAILLKPFDLARLEALLQRFLAPAVT